MKSIDLLQSDQVILSELHKFTDLLCAVKFVANRKRTYAETDRRARNADIYRELLIGEGNSKTLIHFAAFTKEKASAVRAYSMLEEMRLHSWKFTLFANGRVQQNKYGVRNMLDCFSKANQCSDFRAHCHSTQEVVYDQNDAAFTINMYADIKDDRELWFSPCVRTAKFIMASRHDGVSVEARYDSLSKELNTNICPFFEKDKFKLIKQIGKPTRYW